MDDPYSKYNTVSDTTSDISKRKDTRKTIRIIF